MTNLIEERADSKLRFADLHLDEILESDSRGTGDDFEISHEESCLFHIVGAKDAFLQEINESYDLGVELCNVKEGSIRKALKARSLNCEAFTRL